MTALSTDRNTPRAEGEIQEYPVLATAKIYAGSIVVLDANGYAKPGVTATGLIAAGRAEALADNTDGADGDIKVKVRRGVFRYANSASTDEIDQAEVGDVCFIVDDQTVAKLATSRSAAGLIVDVDAQGVWVFMGYGHMLAPGGALLAANDLSDVNDAATAFSAIKQAATAAATGAVELATSAETLTGTDADRAVTPKGAADTYASKLGATIVVGALVGDAINVAIQLEDAAGADLAVRGAVRAYLSDDANGDSVAATAPDGGVAIGSDGLAIPLVADKVFELISEADGDIDLDIEDSGADTWFLILVMPDGRLVASDAIAIS